MTNKKIIDKALERLSIEKDYTHVLSINRKAYSTDITLLYHSPFKTFLIDVNCETHQAQPTLKLSVYNTIDIDDFKIDETQINLKIERN